MIKLKVPKGTTSIGFGPHKWVAKKGVIELDDERLAKHLCDHAACERLADGATAEPDPAPSKAEPTAP